MAQSLEEILGKIEKPTGIPGTGPGEAERVRYVSFDRSQIPSNLFEEVVWKVAPPLAKNGGVILEDEFVITIPDGTSFYALEFNGDEAGWRKQIEQGASGMGLLTAKIEADRFVVSDGRHYLLSECAIEHTAR